MLRDGAKLAPREPRLLLRHASLIENRSPAKALELARRAIEQSPTSCGARSIAARIALTSGDPAEAAAHASEALRLDREGAMARTVRALAEMARGHWGEALPSLLRDGVFEEWSIVARAVLLLLRRWRELGPVRPPLGADAPVLAPDSPQAAPRGGGRASARALYSHVREAYNEGDGEAMLVWLMPMRSIAPDDTDVPAAFATAYYLCGRPDLADPWAEEALRVQAREARAQHKQRRGRKDRSVSAGQPPEEEASPEAVVLAAQVALEAGAIGKARRLAEVGSRRVNPFDRWEARLVLAEALDGQGKPDLALAELAQAVAEEPSVLPLALHRVAAHPFLVVAREVLAMEPPTREPLREALRTAMCRLLTDPRRPRGDRRLARELAAVRSSLPAEAASVLEAYARGGVRALVGGDA